MSAVFLMLLGATLGIGFLANALFERTGVPDVFFLIGVGIFAGPVFGLVSPDSVRPYISSFGPVALAIILFEGGLALDLRTAFRYAGRSLALAAFSFGTTLFLVYYALVVGLNASGPLAWAFSSALACSGSPLIGAILEKRLPDSTARPILRIETAVSGALAAVLALGLSGLDPGGGEGWARAILLGIAAAVGGGMIWLWLLSRLSGHRFFYVMTIGIVFILMAAVELFGGSSAVAVFVFGAVLGNGGNLLLLFPRRLRDRLRPMFDGGESPRKSVSEAHSEISFLIRSFFLVYLGLSFRWRLPDPRIWLAVPLVMVAVVLGREIAVQLSGWVGGFPARLRMVLGASVPRDLATAAIASMVASRSDSAAWGTLAVSIVLLSNLWLPLRLVKIPAAPTERED